MKTKQIKAASISTAQ